MTRPAARPPRRSEQTKRATRLAAIALLLRDGHALTSNDVARMFDLTIPTAREHLQEVGEIVPVWVETPKRREAGTGRPSDIYRLVTK